VDREPEPWQTSAAVPFLTIGEVSVWVLGGDRFRVESPEGSQEVEGIDRARDLICRTGSLAIDRRGATAAGYLAAMSEESTTPDLVEMTRRIFDAGSRHDLGAVLRFYAPDAVLDLSDAALGTFEGLAAIGSFLEDWWGTWGEHMIEVEESVNLGHGVVFSVVWEDGRLVGRDSHVQQRRGWVTLWVEDVISRTTVYLDIDEARAAAERLAEERG
jgi:ketosteroid isomerase-like protein